MFLALIAAPAGGRHTPARQFLAAARSSRLLKKSAEKPLVFLLFA